MFVGLGKNRVCVCVSVWKKGADGVKGKGKDS